MAGLIQDSNFNATFNGHSAAAKRKGGLTFSGRKPLGDLSNSGKPVLKKASEKMIMKNFAAIKEENAERTKKNISKASERDLIGSRKALSDISNSGKPNRRSETSKKNQKIKLPAVTEEPFNEKSIADERFLHNHQECIKMQNQSMDMDQFFKTVGLANNGFPKELPSLKRVASPVRYIEEMIEQQPSAKKLDWSPPKSPDHYYPIWTVRNECISFKLVDTPKLLEKH